MIMEKAIESYHAYLKRKGYSDQTLIAYRRQLRQFARFIDEFYPRIGDIAKIKRDLITDYQDYLTEQTIDLGKPLSHKTIQLKLIALRSFFSFLFAEDYIIANPAKTLTLPKSEQRLPRNVLTEKEVDEIEREALAELDRAVKFAEESPFPDFKEALGDFYPSEVKK